MLWINIQLTFEGPPGTGKTFTVGELISTQDAWTCKLTKTECIAEFTRRPLLSLAVANLGIHEVDIERRLEQWFTLATNWKAVLLIDEADIFLEKRKHGRMKQNSLVSGG